MPDFDYKQRPTTPEYRENWSRIFGLSRPEAFIPYASEKPGPPTPVVERPGPYLSPLDGDYGR